MIMNELGKNKRPEDLRMKLGHILNFSKDYQVSSKKFIRF